MTSSLAFFFFLRFLRDLDLPELVVAGVSASASADRQCGARSKSRSELQGSGLGELRGSNSSSERSENGSESEHSLVKGDLVKNLLIPVPFEDMSASGVRLEHGLMVGLGDLWL